MAFTSWCHRFLSVCFLNVCQELDEVLKVNQGKMIVAHYNATKQLTANFRQKLAEVLVLHELRADLNARYLFLLFLYPQAIGFRLKCIYLLKIFLAQVWWSLFTVLFKLHSIFPRSTYLESF